jgi:uncharacterized protein
MIKRIFLAGRIIGVVLALVAVGPDRAAAQAPSRGAVAAAKELITLKGAASMFDAVVPGVVETARSTFLRTNPSLAKDLGEVAAQLRKEYEAKKGDVMDIVAGAFAERFTEQELKSAVTFYKTPLGKKLIDWEARTLEEGVGRADAWVTKFSEEVVGRMRAEMKKRGHTI